MHIFSCAAKQFYGFVLFGSTAFFYLWFSLVTFFLILLYFLGSRLYKHVLINPKHFASFSVKFQKDTSPLSLPAFSLGINLSFSSIIPVYEHAKSSCFFWLLSLLNSKWTGYYSTLFYSIRGLKVLHTICLVHICSYKHFFSKCKCLLFIHIYTLKEV